MKASALTLVVTACIVQWACLPEERCDPDQVYRSGSCYVCPADAVKTGSTCTCQKPGYAFEFTTSACRLSADAGAQPVGDAAPADGGVGASCERFCSFTRECVVDNASAAGILGTGLSGLGIDGMNVSACVAQCAAASTTGEAAGILECFGTQADTATCAGRDDLAGAMDALRVFNVCCADLASHGTCAISCQQLGPTLIGSYLRYCSP